MKKDIIIGILNAIDVDFDMKELNQALSRKPLNKNGNVVLFSRVSTDKQDLEQQTEELIKEAERNGYNKDRIITIEQKESAIRLSEEERIGIQKLKETIRNNENIDCVIVYEISRIARRADVLYSIRDYLIEKGIQLICIKPYMRLLDDDGKMSQTASILFSLFSSLSESEMMIKKERLIRGKKHKQALGGYIGGKPLWGYMFVNDKLTIDYSKSRIVQKIYNMYEKGLSSRSIAIELMQTGELKQTILNNANSVVQSVLTRPEYYGGKSKESNYTYPAIITKTQFDRCREIASDKTKEHSRVKKICLGKKLLHCKTNGYILTPNIAKGQYKLCTIDKTVNMTIKIDLMDKIIWEVCCDYSKTISENENIKAKLEEESIVLLRKVQQAKRNIEDIKKQIDRIENRIIEGKMSEIKGDRMIEEKRIEMREQEKLMDNCNYQYGHKQEMLYEGTYKQDIETIEDASEKLAIVRKYINKIWLEKTGDKRGHYNIEFVMNNNSIYRYSYWSSGPWNHIERL